MPNDVLLETSKPIDSVETSIIEESEAASLVALRVEKED